jgi:hypothetical protein
MEVIVTLKVDIPDEEIPELELIGTSDPGTEVRKRVELAIEGQLWLEELDGSVRLVDEA